MRRILFNCALAMAGATAFITPSTFVGSRSYYYLTTSKLHSAINIDEETERDIASMEEWSYSYGIGRAEGIQLTGEVQETGFLDVHVETAQDLPVGSSVMYIPNEVILSSNRAIAEFGRLEEA